MDTHGNRDFRGQVLEKVKHIVLGNLSGKACKVYLFGSWARAEEKRSSDIDIAVEFAPYETAAHALLTNLREALEESTIPYKIDVVNLNTADAIIANKVRKEGILWGGLKNE
ncbi:MAG TPA: nucleotidyltransferase domain-containing protein [Bacillales bacterium]